MWYWKASSYGEGQSSMYCFLVVVFLWCTCCHLLKANEILWIGFKFDEMTGRISSSYPITLARSCTWYDNPILFRSYAYYASWHYTTFGHGGIVLFLIAADLVDVLLNFTENLPRECLHGEFCLFLLYCWLH